MNNTTPWGFLKLIFHLFNSLFIDLEKEKVEKLSEIEN